MKFDIKIKSLNISDNDFEKLQKEVSDFNLSTDVKFEAGTLDFNCVGCTLKDLYNFYTLINNYDEEEQDMLLSYISGEWLDVNLITENTLERICDDYMGEFESDYVAAKEFLMYYWDMTPRQADYVLDLVDPDIILDREVVCFNGKYFYLS